MKALTTASGFVLAESGDTLVLLDKQSRDMVFVLFPLAIVTLNIALAGLVFTPMTLMGAVEFPLALALGLLAVGVLLMLATRTVWRQYKARDGRPLEQLPVVATWDFGRDEFRDATGAVIGSLSQIRVHRTVRLGSQGWWLVAKGGSKDVVLVKGVNILGGVGGFVQQLKARRMMG